MDTVTLTREEYLDLIDAREAAIAMREVATGGMETFSAAEAAAYLAARSPLAFWRKHRGLSQRALANAVGMTQPHLAQVEQLARVLRCRIEDLLPIEEEREAQDT